MRPRKKPKDTQSQKQASYHESEEATSSGLRPPKTASVKTVTYRAVYILYEMFKEVKDTDTNMTYYQDQKQTDLKQNGILKK